MFIEVFCLLFSPGRPEISVPRPIIFKLPAFTDNSRTPTQTRNPGESNRRNFLGLSVPSVPIFVDIPVLDPTQFSQFCPNVSRLSPNQPVQLFRSVRNDTQSPDVGQSSLQLAGLTSGFSFWGRRRCQSSLSTAQLRCLVDPDALEARKLHRLKVVKVRKLLESLL